MQNFDIRQDCELYDVARLFFGDEIPDGTVKEADGVFTVDMLGKSSCFCYTDKIYDIIPIDRRTERLKKIALYDALSRITGKTMAWGALTGVRPTKLFYESMRGGNDAQSTESIMRKVYRISSDRAHILHSIIDAQTGKIHFNNDFVNLYIHIPYCPSRCNYCSFVSVPIDRFGAQSHEYVRYLCREIAATLEFLKHNGKKILSVYIGGGTPTSLESRDIDSVLTAIGDVGCEYTCEAGRPDSVDCDKMAFLKGHNVTRVCINPQTLSDQTLLRIGRKHTVSEFFNAYETAEKLGFDINCDLIAGLDGETTDDFKNSFDGVYALKPSNITVHSLAKKNGSVIRFSEGENSYAAEMIDYALSRSQGYTPYYLYRQKRQACNLENVGFSVPGKECINNITTMEETVTVVACGAGAISKFVGSGKIARFANLRETGLYMSRFEEKLHAKLDFFDACFGGSNIE